MKKIDFKKLALSLGHFQVVFMVGLILLLTAIVYNGSIPEKYDLLPGDQSIVDIITTRAVVDEKATQRRALEAQNNVKPVYVRSEELSRNSINNVHVFFQLAKDNRQKVTAGTGDSVHTYETASALFVEAVKQKFGFELSKETAVTLIKLDNSILIYLEEQSLAISQVVLLDKVDASGLKDGIKTKISQMDFTQEDLYFANQELMESILIQLLSPNAMFDEASTKEAKSNAFNSALNNPVMIEKGTKILQYGEVVSPEVFAILLELNLISQKEFNWLLLGAIFSYVLVIMLVCLFYLINFEKEFLQSKRDILALFLAFLTPAIVATQLANISPILIPVYFTAVLIATYLNTQTGIFLTLIQILLVLPMTQFNSEFLFVALIGSLVAAILAGRGKAKYNSASLIIFTSLSCILASLAYSLLFLQKNYHFIEAALWAGAISMISVVAALGFMPIFELLSHSISPSTLINLSQPGSPLLKRLFVEAPGTSQHSMMVANLADAAADAIGANAWLARVGAYYHDIGKLDNPLYFTENQQGGVSLHDYLRPEESVDIILAHPEAGLRIARKYNIPARVYKLIQEHHGTTVQFYFYQKAKEIAEQNNQIPPDISRFSYVGPAPTSKESAVLMLADTCEAAMRSTGTQDLEAAESLIRKLIKQKIDQDQLIFSGLSFSDLEKLIKSFLQVYTGVFHERIKYPDDNRNNQPTK